MADAERAQEKIGRLQSACGRRRSIAALVCDALDDFAGAKLIAGGEQLQVRPPQLSLRRRLVGEIILFTQAAVDAPGYQRGGGPDDLARAAAKKNGQRDFRVRF